MLKDLGLGWIAFVALFALVAMMFTFATPAAVANARTVEHNNIVLFLGEARAATATEFADRFFGAHFVKTGIFDKVQAIFIPTEENKRKAKGFENFLPGLFSFSQKRIDGFWGMIYGSYKRFYLMSYMVLYSLALLFAALVDGLVQRRIVIESKDTAKAVYFHGAKKVLYALILAPLFILLWPWAVNSVTWFIWFALSPVAVWVASKNVQEL